MNAVMDSGNQVPALDAVDRRILIACQGGLPLVERPYHAMAEAVGIGADALMQRLQLLLARGVIRRIGVVPNHYRLGYRANGMTVWDVPDDKVSKLGARVGALPFVSHCYRRPRHLPLWPYNLFAMVHGHDRAEVAGQIEAIRDCLGPDCRAHDVLFSTRILKKTGLRFDKDQGDVVDRSV
ncbi:MAG TPA: Lrp/AsnC family transcriptional regulator [Gammaproteobacteria bacterium]|nr:Lrp/AsnC family transcriptional regulator [Gammaproteobacteria bacterium]